MKCYNQKNAIFKDYVDGDSVFARKRMRERDFSVRIISRVLTWILVAARPITARQDYDPL